MMTEMTAPAIGTKLPLLFTYRDTLFGNGIVVEVHAINGRALCVHESDGFWMYGVNPGGMAAFGDDPAAAHREFRQTFSGILKDLVREANSFEEFAALVQTFFEDTNKEYERDWADAVDAVRERGIEIEGLPKTSADSPRRLTVLVKQIAQVQATDNEANLRLDLAA